MKVIAVVASTVLSFAGVAMAATGQQLAFDHASIMVSPGAPERAALEQAVHDAANGYGGFGSFSSKRRA